LESLYKKYFKKGASASQLHVMQMPEMVILPVEPLWVCAKRPGENFKKNPMKVGHLLKKKGTDKK
jgi:hypothetical protein